MSTLIPGFEEMYLLKWLFTFAMLSLRYIIFAGLAYLLFYVVFKNSWFHKKIQQKMPEARRIWFEMKYSYSSFAVFAAMAVLVGLLHQAGFTQIYTDISAYGWWWFGLSIPLLIFGHDTYFYWTHRIMHHPKLFKTMHKVHHMSHNPSPWAAFSFHPSEAVVEFGFVPLIVPFIPLHPIALLTFSLWMIIFNVMGHVGYEVFPKQFANSWLFKFSNSSTHHNMHHKYVRCNYSLYFNIWDRLMGTNHKLYKEKFVEAATRQKSPEQDKKLKPANA